MACRRSTRARTTGQCSAARDSPCLRQMNATSVRSAAYRCITSSQSLTPPVQDLNRVRLGLDDYRTLTGGQANSCTRQHARARLGLQDFGKLVKKAKHWCKGPASRTLENSSEGGLSVLRLVLTL